MNEIIKMNNGVASLSPETASRLVSFENAIKSLKEREDALKKSIFEEMESKNIVKIDTPELTLTYIAPTDRETFDKKKLQSERPDIYDDYITFTPVKGSLRVKIK